MRALALLAMLALAGCDFAPKLSDNRADVPEAGSENAAASAGAVEEAPAVPAAATPTPTPVDNAVADAGLAAPAAANASDAGAAPADRASAFTPSFDCRGPHSQVETLICNNDRLARLDRRLTRAYAQVRNRSDVTTRANMLEAQRQFLARRNACVDGGCVADAYRDRIDEVERISLRDDSCEAEIGTAAALRLARQCMAVTPATHPPCSPTNSCSLMRNEIERSCAMFEPGDEIPGFCRQ